MAKLELFGMQGCPQTAEMREWLEWRGVAFEEYDVERDPAARTRLRTLTNGQRAVPVLVEDGSVVQIGWQGRACVVEE
jgi:mycoredoxin